MKSTHSKRRKHSESGVALFIAIFVLLLISAVAISLIVASGGESALAGNYRSSASAYFAGAAGLEEARGRLIPGNSNYFNSTVPNFIPNTPLLVGQVRYVLNPGPGESLATLLATYPDTEYATEFGAAPSPANTQTIASVSTVTSGGTTYYGPRFKWVRITPATEKSINTDVNSDGVLNNVAPLYYDSAHLNAAAQPQPSLIIPPMIGVNPIPPSTAMQVLEITALAILPNGSQKTLQYVTTPVTYGLNFPSSLTLAGPIGNFQGANSNPYHINGADGSGSAPAVPGCTPSGPTVSAIGVSAGLDAAGNMTNQQLVDNSLPRPDHYTGTGGTPSVNNVTLNSSLNSPAALDQLVQTIRNNADAIIPNPPNPPNYNNSGTTYNYGGTGWPPDMSATNPKVVYVDGSFNLGPNTGYGLLVVTGNFQYQGNSGWNGIILVIGDGSTTFLGNGGGNGQFNGAIFAATTRDASGNQLSSFGNVSFDINGGGGNGIYYNSCWINRVQSPPSYQVLSFRELH